MLEISYKKLAWVVLLIIMIILFFLSLWLSSRKENKVLEKENTVLKTRLEESYSVRSQLTEEKYYLYDVVERVNNDLVSQTNAVIKLTKSFPQPEYIPIIVRDTIRDEDALSPYRSPEDATQSRGF